MVNMTDFHNDVKSDNISEAIFARQKELMAKYEGIEAKNGLLETPDVPVDIDSYKGQARLKNFAWRVTEELTEALEPLLDKEPVKEGSDEYIHMLEEFIDAVHFMAELTILSGVDCDNLFDYDEAMRGRGYLGEGATSVTNLIVDTMDVIMFLGLAMNCLKNKPWKQTHVTTDDAKYKGYIIMAGRQLAVVIGKHFKVKGNDLLNCYLNKADVNKFRQESGY